MEPDDLSNDDSYLTRDETITIRVSTDRMAAIGVITPPGLDGKLLTKKDIMDELAKAKIEFGISHESIDSFLNGGHMESQILLARGVPAVEGRDASIDYKFEADKNKKPKINEDGSVDYKELDLINHVSEGQLLAVLTPMIEGQAGTDVYNKLVRTRNPKNLVLKAGKGVNITNDRLELFAATAGFVQMDGDKVTVSAEFIVPEDVGPATGNINFNGKVSVSGNVTVGYTIEATSTIFVSGVVEGATLISGEDIILARGVQGGGKAVLQAKGNVIASYMEGATVEAGGYVSSAVIMHSKVWAAGEILVEQKKGLVVGGELMSASKILLKTAGSAMYGTNTLLEVGLPPAIMKEIRQLEKDIAEAQKTMTKVNQALTLLRNKQKTPEGLPKDKTEMLLHLTRQSVVITAELRTMTDRYAQLKDIASDTGAGVIKVESKIYPGVKIVIFNSSYYVRSEMQYCRFEKDGADVRMAQY